MSGFVLRAQHDGINYYQTRALNSLDPMHERTPDGRQRPHSVHHAGMPGHDVSIPPEAMRFPTREAALTACANLNDYRDGVTGEPHGYSWYVVDESDVDARPFRE